MRTRLFDSDGVPEMCNAGFLFPPSRLNFAGISPPSWNAGLVIFIFVLPFVFGFSPRPSLLRKIARATIATVRVRCRYIFMFRTFPSCILQSNDAPWRGLHEIERRTKAADSRDVEGAQIPAARQGRA